MDPMDKEVARIAEGKVDGQDPNEEEATSPSIRPEDMFKLPLDYNHWSKKKQLEFERKKLIKLQDYFKQERTELIMYPKMDRFMKAYSEGELTIFSNMLDQMISSTSAEIYR